MVVGRRIRNVRLKSVQTGALEQERFRLLLEELEALVRDLRNLIREVGAVASCLKD
jgi:hypothetical protein